MTTETRTIEEQALAVHQTRVALDALKADQARRVAEFEAATAEQVEQIRVTAADLAGQERRLRELALWNYERTGSRKPGPGVEIKEFTTIKYDPAQALAWATDHKLALSLDKKRFEDIAKDEQLGFVTKGKEPRATIATDLAKALGIEGER